tara:strand:- start:8486 stop:8938 length:453 start_codon:yes stop_codon:yes gene_type:complete
MNNFKSTKTYKSSKGFSCCFRQWKADSHCKYLHGYSLEISIQFEALNLDKRNWVVDFGGLKELEKDLRNTFDHKTVVSSDDPRIDWFYTGERLGILDLVILDEGVGCEMFALEVYTLANAWLQESEFKERCKITQVEVREHGSNSAIYTP